MGVYKIFHCQEGHQKVDSLMVAGVLGDLRHLGLRVKEIEVMVGRVNLYLKDTGLVTFHKLKGGGIGATSTLTNSTVERMVSKPPPELVERIEKLMSWPLGVYGIS